MNIIERFHEAWTETKAQTGSKAKVSVLDRHIQLAKDEGEYKKFVMLMHLIWNPNFNYGITEKALGDCRPSGSTCDPDAMISLLSNLRARKLTGNDAIQACTDYLEGTSFEGAEVFKWIVSRNPKFGMTPKSFNKLISDNQIPTFYNYKAQGIVPSDIPPDEDWTNYIQWDKVDDLEHYWFEIKYDGNRSYLIIPKENEPYVISSYGFERPSMRSMAIKAKEDLKGLSNVVIDMEFFKIDVQETNKIIRQETDQGIDHGGKFYFIGLMTMDEWVKSGVQELDTTIETMRNRLTKYIETKNIKSDIFEMTAKGEVKGKDISKFVKAAKLAIKNGHEGIMVKDPKAKYNRSSECRKGQWKIKAIDYYDATIVNFTEGTGKNKGMLGAFVVEYNGVENNVGGSVKIDGVSTLSDEDRLKFWNMRHELVDKVIRVRSYGLTKEGKFRHAAFVNFHDEK